MFKTIVQGSSVPPVFMPKLIDLWRQCRFPVEKLTRRYGFDDINTAFEDSLTGAVVKPGVDADRGLCCGRRISYSR